MKKAMRAPLKDALPIVTPDVPDALKAFVGTIYTPDAHNEMREALKMSGVDAGTDLDKIIETVVPGGEIAKMVAFEAARKRADAVKEKLWMKSSGPTAVDKLCDLFAEMNLSLKAPPHHGDYIVADGKGRAFSIIDAFVEVVHRLSVAEQRISDLESLR